MGSTEKACDDLRLLTGVRAPISALPHSPFSAVFPCVGAFPQIFWQCPWFKSQAGKCEDLTWTSVDVWCAALQCQDSSHPAHKEISFSRQKCSVSPPKTNWCHNWGGRRWLYLTACSPIPPFKTPNLLSHHLECSQCSVFFLPACFMGLYCSC